MKRTAPVEREPQYAPLLRAVQFLDAVLRQGVIVGVEDEKIVVDDHQLIQACENARKHIALVTADIERLARAIARAHPQAARIQ